MAEEKMFKTAWNGYQKEEVIGYIEKLNRETVLQRESLKSQIFDLEQENSRLKLELVTAKDEADAAKKAAEASIAAEQEKAKGTIDEYEKRCETLMQDLSNAKEEIRRKDEALAKLREELAGNAEQERRQSDRLEHELPALKQELARISDDNRSYRSAVEASEEKCRQLEQDLEQCRSEISALQDHAERYSMTKQEVSSLLERARKEASDLMAETRQKADLVREHAEQIAKEDAEKIKNETEELVADGMKKVKYLYHRRDEMVKLFEDHRKKVNEMFEKLTDDLKKN